MKNHVLVTLCNLLSRFCRVCVQAYLIAHIEHVNIDFRISDLEALKSFVIISNIDLHTAYVLWLAL